MNCPASISSQSHIMADIWAYFRRPDILYTRTAQKKNKALEAPPIQKHNRSLLTFRTLRKHLETTRNWSFRREDLVRRTRSIYIHSQTMSDHEVQTPGKADSQSLFVNVSERPVASVGRLWFEDRGRTHRQLCSFCFEVLAGVHWDQSKNT